MKYYSYNKYSYNVHGDVESCVVTYTESEIINMHWNFWKKILIEKFGEEHFTLNYSEKDCIDQWVVLNKAWVEEV